MNDQREESNLKKQFTTFYVGDEVFAIEVMKIQEVTGRPTVVNVPLSPSYVRGLVNLRGQIATAVDMKKILASHRQDTNVDDEMSVICKINDSLVSLIVDKIGDVIEVSEESYEETPSTVSPELRDVVEGIYKYDDLLVSIINLDIIGEKLDYIEMCA